MPNFSFGKRSDNFEIKVFNRTQNENFSNNVHWLNINRIYEFKEIDHLIAMSDANLLSIIHANKKYLWSHSQLTYKVLKNIN